MVFKYCQIIDRIGQKEARAIRSEICAPESQADNLHFWPKFGIFVKMWFTRRMKYWEFLILPCNYWHCRVSFIGMMITRVWILLFFGLLTLVCGKSELFAQGAYDSSCYFPQFSNPDDFDTICGSHANQHLGLELMSLPPLKGQQYDRITLKLRSHAPFISAIETGPSFDLHNLKVSKDYKSTPEQWTQSSESFSHHFGHFRSPKYLDLLWDKGALGHPIIFWADENGDYDSSRSTQILPFSIDGHGINCDQMLPYIAKLTSDSVDDIVLCVRLEVGLPAESEVVMALIKGGQQLYDQGAVANWDDTAYWMMSGYTDHNGSSTSHRASAVTGDFRGVGRADYIAFDDWGNLFYYRNELSFSVQNFASAMLTDTLLRMMDYSYYAPANQNHNLIPLGFLSIRAFPKPESDRSVDLLLAPVAGLDSTYQTGIYLFKGGPSFGTKRIGYDSSDFMIHHPGYYDGGFQGIMSWPDLGIAGDITGTGNTVLVTGGGNGFGSTFQAFYVLGKAMDDKIDMFFSLYHSGGSFDTIIANDKGYKSLIENTPYAETDEQNAAGNFETGGLQLLLHGDRIPVRTNPLLAVPEVKPAAIATVDIYPNPASVGSSVSFVGLCDEPGEIIIRDMLGRNVLSEPIRILAGRQSIRVDFDGKMSNGTYIIEVRGKRTAVRGKVSIY
jgi:hypothetical protein